VYIVRNKPATTLTVNKEWLDQNGERVTDAVTLAKQSSVTASATTIVAHSVHASNPHSSTKKNSDIICPDLPSLS
jgi:hypothetical protein